MPRVVLLDRWNDRLTTAGASIAEFTRALRHLESSVGIYVYLVNYQGDLVPVSPLATIGSDGRQTTSDGSPAELAAKVEEAARQTMGFRELSSAQNWGLRANKTFSALDWLGSQMAAMPGRKSLIWVTQGPPIVSDAMIRNLAASFVRSGTAIYSVQSAGGLGGLQDSPILKTLSDQTGGRSYGSDAAERALVDALSDARANYTLAYRSSAPYDEKYREFSVSLRSSSGNFVG